MSARTAVPRLVAVTATALGLLLSSPMAVGAAPSPTPSPSPCASPTAGGGAPTPSPTPSPTPTPSPSPSSSPPSSGPSAAELCRQQAALSQARDKLNTNLQAAQSAAEQLRQSLATNTKQMDEVRGLITNADADIAQLDARIGELDAQIVSIRARIAIERRRLAATERALYRLPDSSILALAGAGSLREALLEIGDIAAAGVRAQQLKRSLQTDAARLDGEVAAQRSARARQVELKQERERQLARLDDLRHQQEATSGQLSEKIHETQVELGRLDAQSAQLAQRIAAEIQAEQEAIIAAAVQQAWEQTLAWLKANPLGSMQLSPGHSTRYRFVWPEPQAQISQGFGPSDLAFEPAYAGYPHFHTGLDLVEPDLSPILAADDGEVAAVGTGTTGYGNYVVLAHAGGLLTLYGHLNQAVVKVGATVVQGQPIGLEGSTGNSTGPHLHFELRIGGVPVDPTPLLPPGPSATRS